MKKNGFTLIELLVVISIIGILTAISIFGLLGARASARDTQRKSDLGQIASALEFYKSDCGKYPVSSIDFSIPGSSPLIGNCTGTTPNTYLSTVPQDPLSTNNYSYASDGTNFYLCASLEKTPSQIPDAIQNCSPCGGNGILCNNVVRNP